MEMVFLKWTKLKLQKQNKMGLSTWSTIVTTDTDSNNISIKKGYKEVNKQQQPLF